MVAGDHVPATPVGETDANGGGVFPAHKVKVDGKPIGVFGVIVTVKIFVDAHWPALGVNVYDPLTVLLITAGAHDPVIPFGDTFAKTGTADPEQNVIVDTKLGTTCGIIETFNT
jgi:hypothetical protein